MKKLLVGLLVFLPIFSPSPVFAHAFGKLYNLPVPFWLYVYGGAGALILSFLIIGYFAKGKDSNESLGINITDLFLFRFLRNDRFIAFFKYLSVFFLILTILTGIVGVDDSYVNFNMTFFWIVFVLGFTYLTALCGNIYASLNPWKTIIDFLEPLWGEKLSGQIKINENMLSFIAFTFYFIFIWIELVGETSPFSLSIILIIYTLINFLGSYLIGKDKWFEKAEFFGVFFEFIGRISPFKKRGDNLYLSFRFKEGLDNQGINFGSLIFIMFMLSSTAFDGFRETILWRRFYLEDIDSFVKPILFDNSSIFINTVALIISPFIFFVLFAICVYISKKLIKSREKTIELCYKFAPAIIPIALAYNFAHYYTLLFTQGFQILSLFSDPFGFGWNLFGTLDIYPNFILDANIVWHTQVAVILVGHIAGVYFSHRTANLEFSNNKVAIYSQIPILILMVIYTTIGLWILSQPLS